MEPDPGYHERMFRRRVVLLTLAALGLGAAAALVALPHDDAPPPRRIWMERPSSLPCLYREVRRDRDGAPGGRWGSAYVIETCAWTSRNPTWTERAEALLGRRAVTIAPGVGYLRAGPETEFDDGVWQSDDLVWPLPSRLRQMADISEASR